MSCEFLLNKELTLNILVYIFSRLSNDKIYILNIYAIFPGA